jgi:LysM repeat protein
MRHPRAIGLIVSTAASMWLFALPAAAAIPHTVQPGESLWSIAMSRNFTTRTVAVFNGLPEDAHIDPGDVIQIPTVEEGAAALQTAGIVPGSPSAGSGVAPVSAESAMAGLTGPVSGAGEIPSPYGTLQLAPAAAEAWNAMREEALASYGIELYPGGPLSAMRSYEQQAQLYALHLSGQGAPANPPGTSSHEVGTAVDLATPEMRQVVDEIGWRYGWAKAHAPDEWWHVDYVGG